MSSGLAELGMWASWQETVRAALPFYARCPIYVHQSTITVEEIERVILGLDGLYDRDGMTRDVKHGARVFDTSLGQVTRQWVDINVEIGFLSRHLSLPDLYVLDIGAGYGRLAAALAPLVRAYTCVDAVPVSTEVCREYLGLYAPHVDVPDLAKFEAGMPRLFPTLAINIHSWNECSPAQISRWLDALDVMVVPYLFTVSHGGATERYDTWDGHDFKHLIAERYEVIAEESIGLGPNGASPHVLWRRK